METTNVSFCDILSEVGWSFVNRNDAGQRRRCEMAYRVTINGVRLRKALFVVLSLLGCIAISSSVFPIEANAQSRLPGYAEAETAFMQSNIDQRIKLQILLTAAGYWPAVPNVDFSTRLFNAICQFEVDNGFVPLGILNNEQMNRLASIGGSFLNRADFVSIRHPHPLANSQIWVPLGLPVTEQVTSTGLRFMNPSYGFILTYDFFPEFNLRISFVSLQHKLERNGVQNLLLQIVSRRVFCPLVFRRNH